MTDTPNLAAASSERVEFIFRRHAETARRLEMPMLVGEWGAYGGQPGTLSPAWDVVGVFEKLLCGETFWAYFPGIEETPSFPVLQRPYPERVAGELLGYRYDPEADRFTCRWRERADVTAPTRVYVPGWLDVGEKRIVLDPQGAGYWVVPLRHGGAGAYLEIAPSGRYTERRLVVE